MPRNEGETHGRVGACVATRVVKTLSQMESLLTLMNADSERNLSGAGAAQSVWAAFNVVRAKGDRVPLRFELMGLGAHEASSG
jgi:hypothetical protein